MPKSSKKRWVDVLYLGDGDVKTLQVKTPIKTYGDLRMAISKAWDVDIGWIDVHDHRSYQFKDVIFHVKCDYAWRKYKWKRITLKNRDTEEVKEAIIPDRYDDTRSTLKAIADLWNIKMNQITDMNTVRGGSIEWSSK